MKLVISLLLFAAVTSDAQTAPLPQIRQNGAVKQFFVDDKPYIMLAGELHNSSASSVECMRPIWDKLATLHLNTVIGTASWELVEPKGVSLISLSLTIKSSRHDSEICGSC